MMTEQVCHACCNAWSVRHMCVWHICTCCTENSLSLYSNILIWMLRAVFNQTFGRFAQENCAYDIYTCSIVVLRSESSARGFNCWNCSLLGRFESALLQTSTLCVARSSATLYTSIECVCSRSILHKSWTCADQLDYLMIHAAAVVSLAALCASWSPSLVFFASHFCRWTAYISAT